MEEGELGRDDRGSLGREDIFRYIFILGKYCQRSMESRGQEKEKNRRRKE